MIFRLFATLHPVTELLDREHWKREAAIARYIHTVGGCVVDTDSILSDL
ncbi:hypothetical protein HPC62_07920 [Thermoleptolyngbya sichuanensis A183]|uniref:Uncharacterized protein n=1 Tax=Thermoleptolyngbya sichuanensis A183 TaxID=2737172 RepID=A0A6M8BG52_9CYAN|nr:MULTISPECIES: hypothetical protein [Thermoleptolyngbya]MDG2615173.1 hypothetical protein [Thermoleptolyngbya sichuanensis XZ-Cy5]QKD82133.1 hypothetical protein HPC62_07920 [Thermoleptolyngbya sichuanensis A183]